MKNIFIPILFLLGSFCYGSSYNLINSDLTSDELFKAESLFEDADSLLPDSIKKEINGSIDVKFNGDPKQPMIIDCLNPLQGTKYLGKTVSTSNHLMIYINRSFLGKINQVREEKNEYNCKHKNYYKEALATLLHETAHYYERSLKKAGKKAISDLKEFRSLVFSLGNYLSERSMDSYEFTSYKESFAVNLEYFLMNPEFKCRKPSLHDFYSKKLNKQLTSNTSCTTTNLLKDSSNSKMVKIEPERLYQIQYLMAGSGKALMSRFGHSMIRLVFCRPQREIGPDCLKDVSHHIVLSFRAYTGNSPANYFNGILGKYPSLLYVLPMGNVLNEYNYGEMRDIFSYPINFTPEQRDTFLKHAIEAHWTYSGKYYFFQNNCASETAKLIESALEEDHPFRRISKSFLSPYALRTSLIKHGLVDKKFSRDIDSTDVGTLLFKTTYKESLELAFSKVKPFISNNAITNYELYTKETSAKERRMWYESSKDKSLSINFYILEERASVELNEKIKDALQALDRDKNLPTEDTKSLNNFKLLVYDLNPWRTLVNSPYGVPQDEEIDKQMALNQLAKVDEEKEKLYEVMRKYFPLLGAEVDQLKDNLKQFFLEE